jgi:DNA adenine methylase
MNTQISECMRKDVLTKKKKRKQSSAEICNTVTEKDTEAAYDHWRRNQKLQKPFVKWVGGKTQIIDKILASVPKQFHSYREIFLGGGSVLLGVLTLAKAGLIQIKDKVYAYDINEPLIYAFKNIQSEYKKVFEDVDRLSSEFKKCPAGTTANRNPVCIEEARASRESYYYYVRNMYNLLPDCEKKTTSGSAMFIFLNKTCFRGMFREGPNGFNVPYGNYKNPKIADLEHLREIHILIQGVEFECCNYTASMEQVQCNDFVYMDPPYVPETNQSFVAYTSHGFSMQNHLTLFSQTHTLAQKENVKIMMCNSDVATVRESFAATHYTTETILCRRAINSKKPHSVTNELLIKNYNK